MLAIKINKSLKTKNTKEKSDQWAHKNQPLTNRREKRKIWFHSARLVVDFTLLAT